MKNRSLIRILLPIVVCVGCLLLLLGTYLFQHRRSGLPSHWLPDLPPIPSYTPWPTPTVADTFGFPLLPADAFSPYVQGVTGPLPVDTRYGVSNPSMGSRSNCFRNDRGGQVHFDQLYHAGIDLFALNSAGQVAWGQATHALVHAVADGIVVVIYNAGSDGYIIITEHLLADGSTVDSVYWHVDHLQVEEGQPVTRGQVIALVLNQGANSHLHWEMRTFRDGTDLFPRGTAGARGTCNGRVTGVGYTWDDEPERAVPEYYGYLDPVAFVLAHQ